MYGVDSIAGEVVSRHLRPFFVFNVEGVFIGFKLQSVEGFGMYGIKLFQGFMVSIECKPAPY